MITYYRTATLTAFILICSACRADDGFNSIRYSVKSYQWWPVIVFLESPNVPRNRALHPFSMIRNAGYDNVNASIPARNIKLLPSDPSLINFNITWYEVVTKKFFRAEIEVDKRDLKKDPVQPEFGVLIFRISGGGDIQAVTYDTAYPPSPTSPPPIILRQVCGDIINKLDSEKEIELERMLNDPQIMEESLTNTKPENVPSNCE